MDNFWDLSDGDDISKTGGQFESGGGTMQPIPNDTTCIAFIEEAKVDQDRGLNKYVSLRWSVLQPAEFKNRKVFQKIWCLDADPRKADSDKARDKAKRMLFAIDTNAGGRLVASGKLPNDQNLQTAFLNKQMQIKVMVYEMEGDKGKITGNWVAAVSPKGGATATATAPAPKATKAAPQADDDDTVPF